MLRFSRTVWVEGSPFSLGFSIFVLAFTDFSIIAEGGVRTVFSSIFLVTQPNVSIGSDADTTAFALTVLDIALVIIFFLCFLFFKRVFQEIPLFKL